jgi:SRSO17 transposase
MNNLALHFLSESPWQVKDLREQRLKLILQVLQGREINLIIDETGDRKKGDKTDYVKRQYIGNLGKVENGIVAVTAVEYGLKLSKNELGWADFRVTNYAQIQKWWEVVMSAYHKSKPSFPCSESF